MTNKSFVRWAAFGRIKGPSGAGKSEIPVEMTPAAARGIEASAESFRPVFDGVFDTLGPAATHSITSSSSIQDNEGSQIVATGALNINLITQGRLIPYATVGAGVISNRGDTPTAELEGNYSILLISVVPLNETDTVNLRHSIDDNVFVGVFGGGVKFFLNQRSGIRVDVRVHLSDSRVQTFLDANPEVETASPVLRAVLTMEECGEKAFRLTERQMEEETQRQGGFDREVRVLRWRAPRARSLRFPGCDGRPGQPDGDVAPTDQGSLVGRPVSDAVFRLVFRMDSRLHPSSLVWVPLNLTLDLCNNAPARRRGSGIVIRRSA